MTSNTLQPLRLIYAHNIVTKSIAIIFIYTTIKTEPYKKALENGEKYRLLFEELLKFDDVSLFTNLPKNQFIEVLDSVQSRADQFEHRKSDEDVLTVAIVNVGFYLDLEHNEQHKDVV